MLLIPQYIKQELAMKFNYIYLYTFFAYLLKQLLSIDDTNAITAFSVIVLAPLYGVTTFILTLLTLEGIYPSLSNSQKRLMIIPVTLVSSFLALFSTSITYLTTHLFRQFFNTILFNILLILLILRLKGIQLLRKYGVLFITAIISIMMLNQIESAILSLIYTTLLALFSRIIRSKDLVDVSKQLFKSSMVVLILLALIIISSMFLGIEQIMSAISSVIRGFTYYSSVQKPLIELILSSEHRLGIDVLGGKWGALMNMFILIITSILFILNTLIKRGRTISKIVLPLGTLILLVSIISFMLPLPWVFQTRVLMFLPWPLCYLCFSYYLMIHHQYQRTKLEAILIIAIMIVPMTFNVVYSYKECVPRWTKPYINTQILDLVADVNEKICAEGDYVVYVIYLPKYGYWEFSNAWLYRNWLYAMTKCNTLIYYGKISDIVRNVNTLDHRKLNEKVYRDYRDVIESFRRTNNEILSLTRKDMLIVIIKPLYQGNDLETIKNSNCLCLVNKNEKEFSNCNLVVCHYNSSGR
jgi:hypothetical protein